MKRRPTAADGQLRDSIAPPLRHYHCTVDPRDLLHWHHDRVREERIRELHCVPSCLPRYGKQPCRERLVRLDRERGHVADERGEHVNGDVAGKGDDIESGAAYARVEE